MISRELLESQMENSSEARLRRLTLLTVSVELSREFPPFAKNAESLSLEIIPT